LGELFGEMTAEVSTLFRQEVQLAKTEANLNGFDEAIMLNNDGHVSEGSGENIVIIRGDTLITPSESDNVLEGITLDTVLDLAKREHGLKVEYRSIDRSELYVADEVFMTGTAAELVPVREIDDHDLGEPGEITRVLAAKYEDALHGRAQEYLEWLDIVEQPSKVTS